MAKRAQKKTGDLRLKWGKRILPCYSRADAKSHASHFIKAGATEIEIQERYPSGAWITTDIITRNSLPLD